MMKGTTSSILLLILLAGFPSRALGQGSFERLREPNPAEKIDDPGVIVSYVTDLLSHETAAISTLTRNEAWESDEDRPRSFAEYQNVFSLCDRLASAATLTAVKGRLDRLRSYIEGQYAYDLNDPTKSVASTLKAMSKSIYSDQFSDGFRYDAQMMKGFRHQLRLATNAIRDMSKEVAEEHLYLGEYAHSLNRALGVCQGFVAAPSTIYRLACRGVSGSLKVEGTLPGPYSQQVPFKQVVRCHGIDPAPGVGPSTATWESYVAAHAEKDLFPPGLPEFSQRPLTGPVSGYKDLSTLVAQNIASDSKRAAIDGLVTYWRQLEDATHKLSRAVLDSEATVIAARTGHQSSGSPDREWSVAHLGKNFKYHLYILVREIEQGLRAIEVEFGALQTERSVGVTALPPFLGMKPVSEFYRQDQLAVPDVERRKSLGIGLASHEKNFFGCAMDFKAAGFGESGWTTLERRVKEAFEEAKRTKEYSYPAEGIELVTSKEQQETFNLAVLKALQDFMVARRIGYRLKPGIDHFMADPAPFKIVCSTADYLEMQRTCCEANKCETGYYGPEVMAAIFQDDLTDRLNQLSLQSGIPPAQIPVDMGKAALAFTELTKHVDEKLLPELEYHGKVSRLLANHSVVSIDEILTRHHNRAAQSYDSFNRLAKRVTSALIESNNKIRDMVVSAHLYPYTMVNWWQLDSNRNVAAIALQQRGIQPDEPEYVHAMAAADPAGYWLHDVAPKVSQELQAFRDDIEMRFEPQLRNLSKALVKLKQDPVNFSDADIPKLLEVEADATGRLVSHRQSDHYLNAEDLERLENQVDEAARSKLGTIDARMGTILEQTRLHALAARALARGVAATSVSLALMFCPPASAGAGTVTMGLFPLAVEVSKQAAVNIAVDAAAFSALSLDEARRGADFKSIVDLNLAEVPATLVTGFGGPMLGRVLYSNRQLARAVAQKTWLSFGKNMAGNVARASAMGGSMSVSALLATASNPGNLVAPELRPQITIGGLVNAFAMGSTLGNVFMGLSSFAPRGFNGDSLDISEIQRFAGDFDLPSSPKPKAKEIRQLYENASVKALEAGGDARPADEQLATEEAYNALAPRPGEQDVATTPKSDPEPAPVEVKRDAVDDGVAVAVQRIVELDGRVLDAEVRTHFDPNQPTRKQSYSNKDLQFARPPKNSKAAASKAMEKDPGGYEGTTADDLGEVFDFYISNRANRDLLKDAFEEMHTKYAVNLEKLRGSDPEAGPVEARLLTAMQIAEDLGLPRTWKVLFGHGDAIPAELADAGMISAKAGTFSFGSIAKQEGLLLDLPFMKNVSLCGKDHLQFPHADQILILGLMYRQAKGGLTSSQMKALARMDRLMIDPEFRWWLDFTGTRVTKFEKFNSLREVLGSVAKREIPAHTPVGRQIDSYETAGDWDLDKLAAILQADPILRNHDMKDIKKRISKEQFFLWFILRDQLYAKNLFGPDSVSGCSCGISKGWRNADNSSVDVLLKAIKKLGNWEVNGYQDKGD